MTPKRKQRLMLVALLVLGVSASVALALRAFQENLQAFYSPKQIAAGEAPADKTIRVGGLVLKGSLQRKPGNLQVSFDVTDLAKTLRIEYEGILPDLFREGQGIVAIGKLEQDGAFRATEVLAKHDENYMPPEVSDALQQAHNEGVGATPTTQQP